MRNILRWLLRQLKRLVVFRDRESVPFSYVGFLISYLAQTALYGILVLYVCGRLSPEVLTVQRSAAWYSYLLLGLGMLFFNSAFEWFYHRYLLHKVVWPWFASQRREHTHHHSLTNVSAAKNEYVIEHPHQTESATFPWYALLVFWALFSVIIVPAQILFPKLPILVSCYPAVTVSLILYETYHAAMHLDYERHWRRWVERYQWVYRLYAFHYMHHANEQVNQAIGGFLGFAIWDRICGTHYIPKQRLPLPDQPLTFALTPPKPRKFVQKWDRMAKERQRRYMRRFAQRS